MKKKLAVTLLILVISLPAFGQGMAKPVIYAGAGLGMPTGPTVFKDYWKMGIGFGGGVGIQINPKLEIIGKVFQTSFPLDDDKVLEGTSGVTIDGLDFKSLEFGVDFKYLFPLGAEDAPFKFAIIAGAGMANIKFTDVTITGDEESITLPASSISETDFAFSFGAGFDYMLSPKAGLWFESRFVMVATEGESTSYLPMRAGVKLLFGK
jgi:hypothetical protein